MAAAVPGSRQLWIFDSRRDLALVVLTPLLIFPLVHLAKLRLSAKEIYIYVLAFGALGHHLPGMMRAYGDRELFQAFRARFIVAPVLLMATCLYLSLTDNAALQLMALTWGVWHGLAQVYGFARIYDAKVGVASRRGALLDRAMCIAWFGGGVLFSQERLFSLLEAFWNTGGPLVTAATIGKAQWIAAVGMTAVTTAWLAHLVWQWRRGAPPSPVKLVFMLSSFAFWWYCMVAIRDVILGIALFEIAHDVQYLAIVWLYNTRRVSQGGRLGGFMRFLFRRSGALMGLYVGLVFAYGSIGLGAYGVHGRIVESVLKAFVVFSGFLHFYYDSFIWSVSNRKTSSTLGLSAAAVERWRAPAWLGHGARWAYFTVPVLLLLSLNGTQAPPVSRYLEASAAFPHLPAPQRRLGEVLLERGYVGEAESSFERALQLRPDFAPALAGLGHIALMRRSLGSAERAFDSALAADPRCAEAWAGMAALHFERRELEQARRAVDRARSLAPQMVWGLVLDARLRHGEGDLLGALGLYHEAAEAAPEHPDIARELGLVYAEQGRLLEAARQLERAVELQPRDPRAREELGQIRQRIAGES